MSKNLSHRLQKLENELQMLLMLQHVSSSENTIKTIGPKQSPGREDIPESTGNTVSNKSQAQIIPLFPKKLESTSCLNERFIETRQKTYLKYLSIPENQQKPKPEKDGHHGHFRPKRSYQYTIKKCNPLDSYIENIQDNICKGSEAIRNIGQLDRADRRDHVGMVTTKSLENDSNKELACKYQELLKEIEIEQNKRRRVEQSVRQLRETLESNKAAIHDMIQSKKLALDMAKQLREKYDSIRVTRKETIEQLQTIKVENNTLATRLEVEVQSKQKLEAEVRTLKLQETDCLEQLTKLQVQINQLNERIEAQQKLLQQREHELKMEQQRRKTKEDPELKALLDTELNSIEKILKERTDELKMAEDHCITLEVQLKKMQEPRKILKHDPQVQEILSVELAEIQSTLNSKILQVSKLQEHCKYLEEALKEVKEMDEKKCSEAEKEFQNMRDAIQEKEQLMNKERTELEHFVEELTELVKQHESRINELSAIIDQQEILLQTQMQNLASKDEQIQLANQETEMLRKKSLELEGDVQKLQNDIHELETVQAQLTVNAAASTCEDRKTLAALEKDIQKWRNAYDSERDKFRIQEKVIQDQNETLHKLKVERGEIKREKEMLQHELEIERQSCFKIRTNMVQIQRKNEQLVNNMENLEKEVSEVNFRPMQEMEQQHMLLTKLEKQVQAKQKEWELQLKLVTKEREQAVAAAQFATQKLMETVNEFQKQVSTQKKVQRMLTSLLSEKEGQLTTANKNVASLTIALQESTFKAEILKQRTEEKLRHARNVCTGAFHEISLKA